MWIISEHVKNVIVTGIEEGVDHLANAVVICGNSQQLMQVFSQTLPPPVVQMLMMRIPVVKQVTTSLTATIVVCFSRLLKCLRILYGKQCGPRTDCSYIGAVCSGSTLFASILNSSVMLGNYLQQTTSAVDIFRCIFFFAL